ncbi:MAG: hypothetical protein ACRDRI_09350 [Pseudonocardiaceae bacterium]
MATSRPPRPDVALSTRTWEWLAEHPHKRAFVRAVWDELAELERFGCPTGPIDALRSVLLHHQPGTRASRCRACRRIAWRRRRFPCPVWFQIGGELLEHPAERGRHRLTATGRTR